MTINYHMILAGVLAFIVIGGAIGIFVQVFLYTNIPSEERCQQIIGYADEQKHIATERFCEYNESGWHFNKTNFGEAFRRTI